MSPEILSCLAARSQWARKLKAYQTSLGFYDLAIAAASMKAALAAILSIRGSPRRAAILMSLQRLCRNPTSFSGFPRDQKGRIGSMPILPTGW
jgi:hypothetical protein